MSLCKRCLTALICCVWLYAACPETGMTAISQGGQVRSMHTIQVGSYKDREDTEREVERIKSFDLQVFDRKETIEGKGMWYRIYVGLFTTRAGALDVAEDLKKRKIVSSYWVKTIAPPFPESSKIQSAQEKPITPEEKGIKVTPASSPPPEIEAPATTPPEPPQLPAPKTPEVEPQQVKPMPVQPIETPPAEESKSEVSKDQKTLPKTNFSIGFKAGVLSISSSEQIDLLYMGTGILSCDFSGTYKPAGLVLSYQLKDRFLLRGSIEKALGANADYYQYTLDAGVLFNPLGPITPFAIVGLIYGDLDWSEFVGDIDSGLGWKIGLGGFYPFRNFQLGAEVSYQAIDFNYDLPEGWSRYRGADSIDYSGFAISAMLMYRF